ncbi:tRNA uracil 4-sulfurtransferase ThiI [Lentilactobacillus hilgardii]|jgi:thiamine biosynthesis protein ThiI|uniref:Probable tRNA sulfurtransferase n=1 Tax=Lentilactobacillus hilgardii TaxID=1588 RepID=A0A6P1E839_LENHI|nr:tRNA uracil 4-sulfurtransferase ThiI [Lentilactobacillus hilgardii]RRG10121.1 MAG: tRNA 4-thiouridine(8) synthase ThiI [Lactobacillus sp.]EEI70439.1 thiamine biosynthesis/tRNA modification protein ThiI [Lentilactobacillus hilgardii ATCC 27305]MCP9331785.1 tRNA 4-thiouridine(8) synthase ThiI [Lentilactobacillus hilgardii]MCP9348352.1 tRNA 4-thiouridine(8) synthase ThiI [Lentilactobacillus hilgardii]MCP9351200.1 tRNA 4-thiouridine(8) synthase ThiI [Lentilactobacillus hilgardii]
MHYTEIMVRYGELSTKGKNKRDFIRQLGRNVRAVLHQFPTVEVKAQRDRLHVDLNGEDDQKVISTLQGVFGIETLYPSIKVEKDMDVIKETALQMAQEQYRSGNTFKINTRRQDKHFEYHTNQINNMLGDYVLENIDGISVDVKNPDIAIRVEVRMNGAYLSSETIHGAGGLPVGTGGRATMMLSGGIDSPVATYLAMKRGVKIDMIHFYSPPYTSEQALNKAKQLTSILAKYSGNIQFIQVPFTEVQETIKEKVPEGYLMTIQRRMMLRIAAEITKSRHCGGVFTGESLGQVASQTLESMLAINDVTSMPVLRPLVSMDKTEIIKISKQIGTYDLSILPYEDCCTIFTPPAPKTKPNLQRSREFENYIDVEGLMKKAVDNIQITDIKPGEEFLNQDADVFAELL